jgi:hypothetical protein
MKIQRWSHSNMTGTTGTIYPSDAKEPAVGWRLTLLKQKRRSKFSRISGSRQAQAGRSGARSCCGRRAASGGARRSFGRQHERVGAGSSHCLGDDPLLCWRSPRVRCMSAHTAEPPSPCSAARLPPPHKTPRRARLRIRCPAPKVHGSQSVDHFIRFSSAPNCRARIVTTSPISWVKPLPGAPRSWIGANSVPRNSTAPSGYW